MGRVTVIGSVNMDLIVSTGALPAPGETVLGRSLEQLPGGKGANQAVAAARAGADVLLVGRVGNDEWADALESFLRRNGVNTDWLRRATGPSGTALVTVATDGSNAIVVVPGANGAVRADDVAGVPQRGDVVVVQLELPTDTVRATLREGRGVGATTLLNASPVTADAASLVALADVVVVNETELAALADHDAADDVVEAARRLVGSGQTVVVTLGEKGCIVCSERETVVVPARRAEVADTTGAGDCFVGVLAAGLVEDRPLPEAADIACAACAVQVERVGAGPAMPNRQEILAAKSRARRGDQVRA